MTGFLIPCASPECPSVLPDHKWGRITSDWFFLKDGRAYCPDHTPDWVAAWRQRRAPAT